MELPYLQPNYNLTTESKIFAQKIGRSISEVSKNVHSVTDVLIFLEILGYNDDNVSKHGFQNLKDLSLYIYNFIDFFEDPGKAQQNLSPIPKLGSRIVEGLAITFQWFGPLMLFFVTGVSLWIAHGLPLEASTALIAGSFFGILMAEGPMQSFSRLFSFYYGQSNLGEARRIVKRSYITILLITASAAVLSYAVASLMDIPFKFVTMILVSAITLALHRISFIQIYSLKKIYTLIFSYLAAFAVLSSVFHFSAGYIADITLRYFASLVSGFLVLLGFALFVNFTTLNKNIATTIKNAPHFYSQMTIQGKTLKSKFSVQFLETMPFFLFGLFYFLLMFSDRILSWIYNPVVLVAENSVLPFSFNFVYHLGADLAMAMVIVPTTIVQYVMMIPTYQIISNKSSEISAMESRKLDKFFRGFYLKLFLVSVVIAASFAILLNVLADNGLLDFLGRHLVASGDQATSLQIMKLASIANIFLPALYATNIYFCILLNRIRPLTLITALSAIVLVGLGILFAQYGFQNIIYAYLIATSLATFLSTFYTVKLLKKPSSIFFAKYV